MTLVDGVPSDTVSTRDRGLAYGDGVFRTFVVRAGRALHWKLQYAKLAADCAALGIRCPDRSLLERELATACAGDAGDHVAKIVITRGAAPRGYAYADDLPPTRIVDVAPRVPYPAEHALAGVRVRRCRLRLGHQPALAGVKHLNRLENVLARAEWSDSSIAEGLLCDADDNVIGGTMTNVFIAERGALATPDLSRCGVAGVTRDRLLAAAKRRNIECRIGDISWNELAAADEVILVNSVAGAWPVREIDGAARGVGPVAQAMQRWLAGDDE